MDDVKASDEKILERAHKRFQAASDYWREIYDLAKEDIKFANGNSDNGYQWDSRLLKDRQAAAGGARPSLTINKIPQHVAQVTNDQRRNKPAIKVRPVDDSGDDEVAEVLNGIIRHIHRNANDCYEGADVAFSIATESQVEGGIGYFRIASDYYADDDKQDLYFCAVHDFSTILDDPAIKTVTGRDRRYLFETVLLDEHEFESQYPDADPIDWDVAGMHDTAAWYERERKQVRVAQYWVCEDVKGKGKRPARRVTCYTLTGDQIVDRKEWPGKDIPYCRVLGRSRTIDGKSEISGIVRNAKDAQRLYNYGRSSQAENLGLTTKSPWTAPAASVAGYEDQWETANNVAYSVLYYNAFDSDGRPLPPPQRIPPTMPSPALSEMVGIASEDIKSTTGQYDASLGQRSNETSGVAIRQRQAEGDMATFHFVDNLSYAIKFAGDILVDVIPKFYDTPRIARILGEDDQADYAEIDPSIKRPVEEYQDARGRKKKKYNLAAGHYDVAVTVGPGYSTQRQEALEFIQAAGQSAPQIMAAVADLLPKLADTPMADEMAKRLRMVLPPEVRQVVEESANGDDEPLPPQAVAMMEQAKQQLGQLAGQLEAMQQGMQQLQAENEKLKGSEDVKREEIASRERIAKLEAEVAMQTERMRARLAAQLKRMELSGQDVEMGAVEQSITVMTEELAVLQRAQGQIAAALAEFAVPKPQTVEMQAPSGQVYRAVVGADPDATAAAAAQMAAIQQAIAQRQQGAAMGPLEGSNPVDVQAQTGVDRALLSIADQVSAMQDVYAQLAQAIAAAGRKSAKVIEMQAPSGKVYRATVNGQGVSIDTPAGSTYTAQIATIQ